MNIHFREITKTDYHNCADIIVDAYKGEPWYNEWTHDEALLRVEATMSGMNARGYIIEVEGAIIAQCLGRVDYYNDNWKQFCIDEFSMLSKFHGKGIGSKFISFVTDVMKQEEMNGLFLMTGGRWAVEFYEKNGFEKSSSQTMMTLEL